VLKLRSEAAEILSRFHPPAFSSPWLLLNIIIAVARSYTKQCIGTALV
jgi:hypothetical protein